MLRPAPRLMLWVQPTPVRTGLCFSWQVHPVHCPGRCLHLKSLVPWNSQSAWRQPAVTVQWTRLVRQAPFPLTYVCRGLFFLCQGGSFHVRRCVSAVLLQRYGLICRGTDDERCWRNEEMTTVVRLFAHCPLPSVPDCGGMVPVWN